MQYQMLSNGQKHVLILFLAVIKWLHTCMALYKYRVTHGNILMMFPNPLRIQKYDLGQGLLLCVVPYVTLACYTGINGTEL